MYCCSGEAVGFVYRTEPVGIELNRSCRTNLMELKRMIILLFCFETEVKISRRGFFRHEMSHHSGIAENVVRYDPSRKGGPFGELTSHHYGRPGLTYSTDKERRMVRGKKGRLAKEDWPDCGMPLEFLIEKEANLAPVPSLWMHEVRVEGKIAVIEILQLEPRCIRTVAGQVEDGDIEKVDGITVGGDELSGSLRGSMVFLRRAEEQIDVRADPRLLEHMKRP